MKIYYSIITITILAIFVISCAGYRIDRSISNYETESSKIQLGDSKQKVLLLLEPTQPGKRKWRKNPEKYLAVDGSTIEIYYYRSSRQADGLTTDDEFTPYVFKDDVLIGIGWTSIGGPKTQGQAPVIIYD